MSRQESDTPRGALLVLPHKPQSKETQHVCRGPSKTHAGPYEPFLVGSVGLVPLLSSTPLVLMILPPSSSVRFLQPHLMFGWGSLHLLSAGGKQPFCGDWARHRSNEYSRVALGIISLTFYSFLFCSVLFGSTPKSLSYPVSGSWPPRLWQALTFSPGMDLRLE